ncbi:unnamed protein product, partial [Bubo scandiacus]
KPQRGTPVGSSLRTQTDGPPALPTENTLLAAGAESTAPSKQPNQPGQPTQTPSISPHTTSINTALCACASTSLVSSTTPGTSSSPG